MAGTKGEQWNEPRFIEAIKKRGDEEELLVAEALLEWAKSQSFKIVGGRGESKGTLSLKVASAGRLVTAFTLNSDATGYLSIHFEYLRKHEPFTDLAQRQQVLRQLQKALLPLEDKRGRDISLPQADKSWPGIPFGDLADEQTREAVLKVLNGVVAALK